jgi:glucose/arabinose dehydrogenase
MKGKLASLVILAVVLGLLVPVDALAQFTTLPQGFSDQLVVDDVPNPTAIAWLPSGEMLITSQTGRLFRRSANGQNVSELSLPIGAICTNGERGLLGVAVDPNFDRGNPFVYLFYSHRRGGDCGENVVNRVSRLLYENGSLGAERVLIDNIPSPASNHNGGDLQFGRNGLLHISVGDGGADLRSGQGAGANANARRLDVLLGKILRIDTNGGIPSDNPFQGPGTARCAATGGIEAQSQGIRAEKKNKSKKNRKAKKRKRQKRRNQQPPQAATICQEIFATGLRNPFRIAFDPDDVNGPQRFYINDVGQNVWEEIDSGFAGADYGWNEREGPCPTGERGPNCPGDGRFVDPVYAYEHQDGCNSITGGAFVPASAGWTGRTGSYIFSDFVCGRLFELTTQAPGDPLDEFASGLPPFQGAIHLAFGPDGALYYTTFAGGGQVRKIDN